MRRPVLAALALAALGAGPAPAPAPPARQPVAEAPALRPGDCWQYRNLNVRQGLRDTVRCVVRVLNDGYLMETHGRVSGLARYDRNLVWLGSIGADRTIRQPARSEVPLRMSFPLWPGKNWSDAYRTLDAGSGGFSLIKNVYVVERVEEIEVPAGRFAAFRIKRIRTNTATDESATGLTWYAPAVQNVIRVRNEWRGGTKMVLSAFDLSGARNPEVPSRKGEAATALMRASHILVKDRATAEEVLRRLKAGEDFAALAREYSLDPSKRFGGDVGYFKEGEILPEIEEAVRKLRIGEVAGPIQSELGLHIVKRTG